MAFNTQSLEIFKSKSLEKLSKFVGAFSKSKSRTKKDDDAIFSCSTEEIIASAD
jgi:hypothetical protein